MRRRGARRRLPRRCLARLALALTLALLLFVPFGFSVRPESRESESEEQLIDPWAKKIPLTAGWAPTTSRDLPLRKIGQTCWINATNPSLSACLYHLLVVGLPKSGTTVLARYLLTHPQIRLPPQKEAKAFEGSVFNKSLRVHAMPFSNFVYLSDEANSRQINADFSPTTLSYVGCQRLAAILPSTSRFVVMLRQPFDRILSVYRMSWRRRFLRRATIAKVFANFSQAFDLFRRCSLNLIGSALEEQDCQGYFFASGPPDRGLGSEMHLGSSEVHSIDDFISLLRMEASKDKEHELKVHRCLDDVEAFNECLKPGQDLNHLLLRALNISGIPFRDYDMINKAQDMMDNLTTRALTHRCWQYPHASGRLPKSQREIDMYKCVGLRCECKGRGYLPNLLDHCLEYIDRSRILFLDMEELKVNPYAVLTKAVEHAGLEAFDFSRATPEAKARVEASLSKFKETIGWSSDSSLLPPGFDNFAFPPGFEERFRAHLSNSGEALKYLRQLTGLELRNWK